MQLDHLPTRRVGRWVSAAALVPALALATACAGGPAVPGGPAAAPAPVQAAVAPTGVQQVTVRVGDGMRFDPSAIAVTAGQPVQLTLESVGGAEHDFTLTEGVARPVKIAAAGQQTASGTFTIERPGTYAFVCSVPGHALAGMRGTITAQ
jgi:nitrite reductase (NO-forming)